MFVYVFRAAIFREQGDTTMSIVNYTQAIKQNPDDYEAHYQRAEMYEQVNWSGDNIHVGIQCAFTQYQVIKTIAIIISYCSGTSTRFVLVMSY